MSKIDFNILNYNFNYLPDNKNSELSGLFGIILKNSNAIVKNTNFSVSGYSSLITDNSSMIYKYNKVSGQLAYVNNNSVLSDSEQNNNICIKNKDLVKILNNSFINFPKLLKGSIRIFSSNRKRQLFYIFNK